MGDVRKKGLCMIDTDFFDLLYAHMEEHPVNNILENLKLDINYREALQKECDIYQ